jgi:antitoxin (DNA-binding transcriptional repressor) of toxin-antitoxin stability system
LKVTSSGDIKGSAMTTVTVEEAQSQLTRLIENLQPGEVITITRDEKPFARLTAAEELPKTPRKLGTLRGTVRSIAPDFDAPLDEFADYME